MIRYDHYTDKFVKVSDRECPWCKAVCASTDKYCHECGWHIADTPQTDKDKVVCPNCGRSDYIRSFEKDFNIKNSEYRYKCINCNTYIKDAPQTDCETRYCEDCKHYDDVNGHCFFIGRCTYEPKEPRTDCGWK